jgi:hypothetical protein
MIDVTPNEAKCFQYEIWHIALAASHVRKQPVNEIAANLNALDSKIKILAERIDTTFGTLAKEASVG